MKSKVYPAKDAPRNEWVIASFCEPADVEPFQCPAWLTERGDWVAAYGGDFATPYMQMGRTPLWWVPMPHIDPTPTE